VIPVFGLARYIILARVAATNTPPQRVFRGARMAGEIEARLSQLGIELPVTPAPVANYVPTVESRGFLYVSGQISIRPNGEKILGRLSSPRDIEAGRKGAEICAINLLSQAKAALGDLDRVARVVKLTGFVNSAPEFADQPKVINGASDLLVSVFGERGRHARSSIGVAALPYNAAVEVDAVFEIA
jgi:enamine deaminase RidA (YjgF/YER057c/UK114 family)